MRVLPELTLCMISFVGRNTLGDKEGNQFIAETFGPDGDSEDSEADAGEEAIEYTEREMAKLEIWKEFESSSGRHFWYNKYTRETSWVDPLSEKCEHIQTHTVEVLNNQMLSKSAIFIMLQDLPDGWVQRQSRKKGFVYYQDIFSGERVWEQPLRAPLHRKPLDELGGLLTVSVHGQLKLIIYKGEAAHLARKLSLLL